MVKEISALRFVFLIGLILPGINCGRHEKRLLAHLFDEKRSDAHNVLERPTAIESQPVKVALKIILAQIIDVDEKNQILTTSMWLDMKWSDYMFKWDPKSYGNISTLRLHHTRLWKPDILMYNSANEKFDSTFPTNIIVSHTSDIQYIPPGMFKTTCEINIKYFPFDRQECVIKFGSWTYHGNYINLTIQCEDDDNNPNCFSFGKANTESYVSNGEWSLLEVPAKRNVETYSCCPDPYIDVKIYIRIQRRALYYIFNLIIPCILISVIALLVFMLPPDAGEKMTLGVTILLSMTMFLLLVAENLPRTSNAIPLIGFYFSCIMFLASLSVVFTVLVLNYHHRGGEDPHFPDWIKKYINLWLAKLVLMKPMIVDEPEETAAVFPEAEQLTAEPPDSRSNRSASRKPYPQQKGTYRNGPDSLMSAGSINLLSNRLNDLSYYKNSRSANLGDDFRVISMNSNLLPPNYYSCMTNNNLQRNLTSQSLQHGSSSGPNLPGVASGSTTSPPVCTTKRELERILGELRAITKKIKDDEQDELIAKQWRYAARVIDRTCLILCAVFTVFCTVCILLSAETLWDGKAENSK